MEKIILFYKYIDIQYPKQVQKWQAKLCESLGLKGRIILACEGINATLGGLKENVDSYIQQMNEHPLFKDIDFKESLGSAECFPKLQIKIKNEIVTLGLDPRTLKADNGGKHLKPEEVHEFLNKSPEDLIVLDARNSYESQVGYFKKAELANIRFFREFPNYIDSNLEKFKDKQVLMYCTGGIRCERASAYLKSKNVAKEVFQVSGGIHRYVEEYTDGHFVGKNYVFDGRVTVNVNNQVVGKCYVCKTACDEFTNCFNASCNRHFICCANCLEKLGNTCSVECKELLVQKKVNQRPPLNKVEFNKCQN